MLATRGRRADVKGVDQHDGSHSPRRRALAHRIGSGRPTRPDLARHRRQFPQRGLWSGMLRKLACLSACGQTPPAPVQVQCAVWSTLPFFQPATAEPRCIAPTLRGRRGCDRVARLRRRTRGADPIRNISRDLPFDGGLENRRLDYTHAFRQITQDRTHQGTPAREIVTHSTKSDLGEIAKPASAVDRRPASESPGSICVSCGVDSTARMAGDT